MLGQERMAYMSPPPISQWCQAARDIHGEKPEPAASRNAYLSIRTVLGRSLLPVAKRHYFKRRPS